MSVSFRSLLHALQRVFQRGRHFPQSTAGKLPDTGLLKSPVSLRWVRRRGLSVLGWPGIAGIGLLSICPAIYLSAILPLQERAASASTSVTLLEAQSKDGGREQKPDLSTPEAQLDEFYRTFPEGKNMPDYLEKIFSLAQAQEISLDQGEYRVTRGREGNLVSFQMSFPVKGRYPQIRKYVTALLAEVPALSLQQVQFKRRNVGDSLVEANIRLVLYFLEQKP